jgi:predicted alpha/beta-hydrolase family hydrolase
VSVTELETPHGPARAHVHEAADARAVLVLGHGAGGGVTSRDLVTARDVALSEDITTVLVEQPYRVAGRRSPAPAPQLDAAWTAVVDRVRNDLPLIVGGRSSGARVACRTAETTAAVAVLCLAFPLHPPGRPEKTRLAELDAVRVPTLVVQGARDPFGIPPPAELRTVALVQSDHSLRGDLAALADAVRGWLRYAATAATAAS